MQGWIFSKSLNQDSSEGNSCKGTLTSDEYLCIQGAQGEVHIFVESIAYVLVVKESHLVTDCLFAS